MKRTMIASVLSLALAATSFTAAPARADEDVFKVIAGLVALGVIANTVKHNKERKAAATRGNGHTGHSGPRHPRREKVAPRRCLRTQWTHRGDRQVYGARCMQNNALARLPQKCLRQAQNTRRNSGPRAFYTKRCLRGQGWRL